MELLDRITLPNRTLCFDGDNAVKRTVHFKQRSEARGFNLYDAIYLLCHGKVTAIKNGCFKLRLANVDGAIATMVVAPKTYGYLLITIYGEV
jgi:hypothetical protein